MLERLGLQEAETEAHFIDLVKRIRSASTEAEAHDLFRPNYPPDGRHKHDLWKRVQERKESEGMDDRFERVTTTAKDFRAAVQAVRAAADEEAAMEILRTMIPEILEYDWSEHEDPNHIGLSRDEAKKALDESWEKWRKGQDGDR